MHSLTTSDSIPAGSTLQGLVGNTPVLQDRKSVV